MSDLNTEGLQAAAADFLYLLERGYPRGPSLTLVGNRYNLNGLHRQLLHRSIFSTAEAKTRRSRLVLPDNLTNNVLFVDGHNVIITVESALAGRPLIAANDGVIRDVAGVSHRHRLTSLTREAIGYVLRELARYPPEQIRFFLDAPIRHSGELAALIRTALRDQHLSGDAQAVRVPEEYLIGSPAIVATSDSAILDRVERAIDLAGLVIRSLIQPVNIIEMSHHW